MLAWRRLDVLGARARLGRRAYDPRGARPREWARPRHVRSLLTRERERFTLGRLDGCLLAADPEVHLCRVMPTARGKTTHVVVPAVLEHRGPVLVTSTKRDVLEAARLAIREER